MSAPDYAGHSGAQAPGPWRIESGYGYTAIRNDDEVVANMRYVGGFTNQANARLIAAAPDLLAALKLVAFTGAFACFEDKHWDVVNAAIAKAESGQC